MIIDTVFFAFNYFFGATIMEILAVAFFIVFVLIILYYTNREEVATGLVANISTVFTDVSPLLLIVVGAPFAIYIIKKVLSLVPKR